METKNDNITTQNKKYGKKNRKLGGLFSAFLVLLIIIFTFLRTPQQITEMLVEVTSNLQIYFMIVHIVMILSIIVGSLVPKFRNQIFFIFVLYLSLSATVISAIFLIIPNIILFGLVSTLLVLAFRQNKLKFTFKNLNLLDIIFGLIGIIFGFWYLHWVEDPVWLNALLYSPLGGVNCPTLVMISGFICFTKKPRLNVLEITLGALTLYFGFFGIFRLQAYVDITLVLCGGYLLVRNTRRFLKKV